MTTVLVGVLCSTVFFALGWLLNNKIQQKVLKDKIEEISQAFKDKEQRLLDEQTLIADKFFEANRLDMEEKGNKLNHAFLENGRTVELISAELVSAQRVIDNAFSALPHIYTCSQKTNQATQKSKEKINALSSSVDSWQGSMETLRNIQGLIDAIYDKATQIRDVSAEANLLALNASIEAARAGEHGRGFAVVATSMRELSNKSAEATLEINSAVDETRSQVGKIVNGISDSATLLAEVSSGVRESFAEIEVEVSNIDSISQTSLTEADSAKEQFSAINKEVNNRLESITRLLADTLGEVTGNKIENVSVSFDFSGMQVIDVRRPDEFNAELGHIADAKLICLQDNFDQRIQELDKTAPYLFVCRSGGRSARAARVALGSGFKNIFNMEGGMLEYCRVNGTPPNASAPI